MTLTENFDAAYAQWADINDRGWQDWFNPDIPAAVVPDFTSTIIADMLDQGETHWNHPGWIRDLWCLLDEWAIAGYLIRVRLTAEWLLMTLPDELLDEQMGDRLALLAMGQFCEVYQGEVSLYPRHHEFYLRSLQWNMAEMARRCESSL